MLKLIQDQHLRVVHGEEGDRDAGAPGAARPPDAVRVVLDRVRHVVVDHHGHVGHVDAAAGDVGGDQHAVQAVAEALKPLLALVLRAAMTGTVSRESGSLILLLLRHRAYCFAGIESSKAFQRRECYCSLAGISGYERSASIIRLANSAIGQTMHSP